MNNQQHPQHSNPGAVPGPVPGPGGGSGVENLEEGITALLDQATEGAEEAALLEEAHSLVSKALGQS